MKTDFTNCKLELSSTENYDDYYLIRSEKKNLFWTGYSEAPDYNNFFNWYKNRTTDNDKDLYLLFNKKQCIGSLNIDYYSQFVYIGYSVKEEFEGKGYGTYLVDNAIKVITESRRFGDEKFLIKAWINYQNVGSIKVVEKNGFIKSDVTEIRKRFGKAEKYYEFVLEVNSSI